MTQQTREVTIIGAGPYGISAAAHLRRAGIEAQVFGKPMAFWRGMPKGMLLRSNWSATNIAERRGELSLDSYQRATGARFGQPVPLERFVEYGCWVQHSAVPDLDERNVSSIEASASGFTVQLDDGERLATKRVVVASGIGAFAQRPPNLVDLPTELASHTGEHSDLCHFAGKSVAVIGGGQSALECAALLSEAGAHAELFVRAPRVTWLRGVGVKKRIGRLGPVLYAPTDVGPLWYSRLVATPAFFRQLPRELQLRIARRCIRPAGAHWLRGRLAGVPINFGCGVVSARPCGAHVSVTLEGGSTRTFDHLLLGTGYRVNVAHYPFISGELMKAVDVVDGYPVLTAGMESSMPGLHFIGAPAAWSFGPIMRFVSGTWYTGHELARSIGGVSTTVTGCV